jgi:hypothetical protein
VHLTERPGDQLLDCQAAEQPLHAAFWNGDAAEFDQLFTRKPVRGFVEEALNLPIIILGECPVDHLFFPMKAGNWLDLTISSYFPFFTKLEPQNT